MTRIFNEVHEPTWTCDGETRGSCGIRHRSYETALKCCERDDRDCKRGFGPQAFSDRLPRENARAYGK